MLASKYTKLGLAAPSALFRSQLNNSIFGRVSAASFAKYDRSKPHVNVGTIGKIFTYSKFGRPY